MKQISLTLLLALAMLGAQAQRVTTTVSGTATGFAEGTLVKLFFFEPNQRDNTLLDSVKLADGRFEFKEIGTEPGRFAAVVAVGSEESNLIFLEGGTVKVTCNASATEKITVGGTPSNDALAAMSQECHPYAVALHEIAEKYEATSDEATKKKLQKEYMALQEVQDSIMRQHVLRHPDTHFAAFLLPQVYYNMQADELKRVLDLRPASSKNDARIKRIADQVERQGPTMPGKPYKDFELATPAGKPAKLSDYVGKHKLVLIDFWASWCGPCRADMPEVVQLYKTYRKKGLEIVGVSLDNKADAWQKAIGDLGITWPQMSDLQGWKCAAANLYGVNAIPATVLIAEDGTIVARNLRGEKLAQKVAELLP